MKYSAFILSLLIVAVLMQCKKTDSGTLDNPYKNKTVTPIDPGDKDSIPDPATIQGLHRNLFAPTCANSGCHDGTFEPDFRTVQSSYASLVNQAPIKNDPGGTFSARVVPGNADGSILLYRMTVDLGGNSGIMPLVIDPGSDYPDRKDEHLANIRKWINDGAKDFNGNSPQAVDFPPTLLGVRGLSGGNALNRGGIYETMYAGAGQSFVLWFSLSDDHVSQGNLTNMKINWSSDPDNFDPQNEKPLVKSGPQDMPGLFSPSVSYQWSYSYDGSANIKDDVVWFRITMSDGTNADYQLPNNNSMFFLKKYFAVKFN